jgi:Ser/Thr protein kinase RdoA (MazF antagonist)
MLNVDNAIPYLLEHGLIDPQWIIDGDVTIQSAARRNRNLRFEGAGGAGYLIKQAGLLEQGRQPTLDNEAAFLEFCHDEPALAQVARHLPAIAFRDRDHSLHALRLLAGATTLHAWHRNHEPRAFPVASSRAFGQGLGTIHAVFRLPEHREHARLAWLPARLPGTLQDYRPSPMTLATISPAGARVFRILQEHPEVGSHLGRLSSEWRPETVIHGDIKSDNILLRPGRDETDSDFVELWIVDWEFVQVGDPAWDVAGALHDYLVFWTAAMPLSPALTPEEMVGQARYPLEVLWGAIHAFWEGYQRAAELNPAAAACLMRRSVLFSAARLIQAAYELSAQEEQIPAQAVILMQLSANILAEPALGQALLYGISGVTKPR